MSSLAQCFLVVSNTLLEFLFITTDKGESSVDGFGDVSGDERRMTGLGGDIIGVCIRLCEGFVRVFFQIKNHIKEVHNRDICLRSNSQSFLLKHLDNLLSQLLQGLAIACQLGKTIITIESNTLLGQDLLHLSKQEEANQLADLCPIPRAHGDIKVWAVLLFPYRIIFANKDGFS